MAFGIYASAPDDYACDVTLFYNSFLVIDSFNKQKKSKIEVDFSFLYESISSCARRDPWASDVVLHFPIASEGVIEMGLDQRYVDSDWLIGMKCCPIPWTLGS